MLIDFRERRRERENRRETSTWERNIHRLPSIYMLTGDRTHNPGMCPDHNRTYDLFVYWLKLRPTNWATWARALLVIVESRRRQEHEITIKKKIPWFILLNLHHVIIYEIIGIKVKLNQPILYHRNHQTKANFITVKRLQYQS